MCELMDDRCCLMCSNAIVKYEKDGIEVKDVDCQIKMKYVAEDEICEFYED